MSVHSGPQPHAPLFRLGAVLFVASAILAAAAQLLHPLPTLPIPPPS